MSGTATSILNTRAKIGFFLSLVLSVCVCLVSLPVSMEAQAISGDLRGTVMDSSGAVIPDAAVVATNIETGVKANAKTNSTGEYHFMNLLPGRYSVIMTGNGISGGYKEVLVQLNKQSTANITASVSSQGETVEVTAGVVTLDTTTQNIQNTFELKENQDLPSATVGLGVLNLSLLNAGVATSGGLGAGTGPSVSGQRPRNNNFTIEGVDNNNKGVTGPVVTIPNDAVQNFTVLQNQFSPEFGHSSGGQFNQTIVSGTNKWHGRAYEYFQNRNLDAIDAQDARTQTAHFTNPARDDNRFGGQLGGAIKKDKIFFFTNQEYNPTHKNVGTATACAPTALGYTQIAGTPGVNPTNLAIYKKFLGTAATAATTSNPFCPQFTGGVIQAQLGEVDFAGNSFNNTYTTANSVDINLSTKDQIRLRYIYQKNNQTDIVANLPIFFAPIPFRAHVLTLSEYHTFGPTLTNEFRLGFNRFSQTITAGNFTFPGLDAFPNLSFDDTNNNIGPNSNAPQATIQNVYQATDNISWVKGKHNLKFGIEGRKYITPQQFTQRARGDYEYATTDEYLLDQSPSSLGQRSTGSSTYYGDQSAIYVYGNDEFRVTKNLTLDLGLRYEFTSVPFGERRQSLNSAASVPGLIKFGAPQPQYNNYAPRVGFAYSPGNSGTTSIRGGFGIAYDVLYDNIGQLAPPPQLGGTCDVSNPSAGACTFSSTAFLANGGFPAGRGTGLQTFATVADQRAATSNFLPTNTKLPYTESWNFGVQHVFASKYTFELRYVGTRGIHLDVQQQLNRQPRVSPTLFLPTFLTAPDAATINGLTTTLAQIKAQPSIIPAYAAAGFTNTITSYPAFGQSIYHGLQAQVRRNLTNNLQFQVAYTWSHAQDNSTADFFSTLLTPRRAQNSQNYKADYSTSALDRRQRLTIETIYNVPFFKGSSNWFAKNLIGNWEIAPTYTFQSPEYFTPQSGVDSNLNGDTAPDRTVVNASGTPGTGSTVTAVTNAAGDTVGYVADNPNARYIQAGLGALATDKRNSLATRRTNNWDLSALKRFSFTERTSFEFGANAFNVFNHSQYIPGSVNTVNELSATETTTANYVKVNGTNFNDPTKAFHNNARILQLSAKFIF